MSQKENVLGQPAMTQILSKLHDKTDEEKKVKLTSIFFIGESKSIENSKYCISYSYFRLISGAVS